MGLLVFANMKSMRTNNEEEKDNAFCGVVDLSENASEGKKLFRSYCAMCHLSNLRKDGVGPALHGSFSRWNKDTLNFQSYLQDSRPFESAPRIKEMRDSMGYEGFSHSYTFTKEEVKLLIEFIEPKS